MALLGLPSSSSAFSASLVFAKLPPATADSIPAPSPSRFSFQGLGQSRLPNFSSLLSACRSKSINFLLSGALAFGLALAGVEDAEAAKTGVNKPELLPKEFTPVIDVAGFLSDGQERRIAEEIASIERDTGFKLRILAQNYPDTPGLAIKDFWNVDDRTIVFVADPTFGKTHESTFYKLANRQCNTLQCRGYGRFRYPEELLEPCGREVRQCLLLEGEGRRCVHRVGCDGDIQLLERSRGTQQLLGSVLDIIWVGSVGAALVPYFFCILKTQFVIMDTILSKSTRHPKYAFWKRHAVYEELNKPEEQRRPLPVDEDLPGMGQYYCLHCDRYFSNVAVRDEHFKTKRHKKRVKQMMGPTPHTQVDADLAAGMGMPDNGPKLMLM
ncbi:hypothetical protein SAY86_024729 [Trapa natans]|uniref:C2H2-type domain-containing protein n=1 Tax=Trapa natans TaxID=22666 RepID=A0AAN7M766_TRANT|nr:hypothetical protein SAY86_024729 [Trapa natans]